MMLTKGRGEKFGKRGFLISFRKWYNYWIYAHCSNDKS